MPRLRTVAPGLAALACAGLIAMIETPLAAQNDSNSLGTVTPRRLYEPTVIAVPMFGRDDSSPVEFDTVARVVRRDLELTGFFTIAPNQSAVNQLNIADVRNSTISFDKWGEMGVEHLLMANIASTNGTLSANVLLYDVPSRRLIMSRNIEGRSTDVRMLAHRIADDVVEMTKFTQGFAQTQLLYITAQVPGVLEVGLMDSDGFNQRPMTRFGHTTTTPSWGANGTEFYYTSYHGNRGNIYGQQFSTGQTWTIAAYGGTNHSAEWNPRIQRLVMVLSKDGGSEIYTADRLGQDLRRLTETPENESSPTWSPDGSKIAYVSDVTGRPQIYLMNADGSGKRALVRRGNWQDAPTWAPDGTRIAFVSRDGGRNDIYVVNADGDANSVRRLTINQGNNESPSWAPNSRHLAFMSDRTGSSQIFLMLDDGSNQQQLTTSGRNTQPKWGPAPR